jgi:uncharacterized protein (TIGR03546 family)
MLLRFIRPLRVLARLFTAAGSPRQLALGLAVGMLVGLVPKGNLTAILLMGVLLASRVNLGTGMIGAVMFSWLAAALDPLSHRIGEALLTRESLQPMWTHLYRLPLAPWTALNNTVVLGSLLLGLWLFYPVYRLSELGFAHGRPRIGQWVARYRIGQVLAGAEIVAGRRVE